VSECKIDRSLLSVSVDDVCPRIVVFLTKIVLNCLSFPNLLSNQHNATVLSK